MIDFILKFVNIKFINVSGGGGGARNVVRNVIYYKRLCLTFSDNSFSSLSHE